MYKNIVVCVNETHDRENLIGSAARFASQIEATLTGFYIRSHNTPGVPLYGYVADEIIKQAIEHDNQCAEAARETFKSTLNDCACDADWLEVSEDDEPMKELRLADLIITNRVIYDAKSWRSNINFINSLILETGRPVILIPEQWNQQTFGRNIVFGWDQSREAVRAMQDAMPIFKRADHVDAVCVDYQGKKDSIGAEEICKYLSKHNVTNNFSLQVTNEYLETPEKVLLNYAREIASDLIVVGGYGHSRLREIILGGVTRYLTKNSDVPVLLSH